MDIILLKCDEVLCIQVIPLKRTGSSNEAKAMKLVEANIGNLAKAYEKIIKLRWFSPETFHFFSKESSWEIKSVDEEDREKDLPVGAFKTIAARPLVPREKFQGSDEEYQKEVENFETLKKLKTDYANDSVKAAIKKSVKGKNFMETLLLTEMSSHDEDTKFLLVYGKSLSGEFSTDEIRRVRNKETGKLEIGPVCLLNVQDSHLKVGQIDFRADFLADHIIYGLRVDDSSSSYELSNPQFQLVDINLNPISSLTEETESTKKKKPTPHITIEGVTSSSIKTLQIIGVDNHVRNLLLQNAGHVEDAYPEIVKHATEKKSITDKIRFFSDESDIVAKNYRLQKKPDSKVKTEIIKDIHNLDKKEEKRLQEMGFWGDEINSALHRIFIGCKNFVWEAVRRLLDSGNLWPYEHYLLVVGEGTNKCSTSGSAQYEIPNEDKKGNYDCLQLIGVNENVEIGSLKFKVGILADHIIFNGSINHPNDKDATDSNDKVLSNPQFQLCDCLLNPVDMPETSPNSDSQGAQTSNSEGQDGGASGNGHKTVSINIEGTSSSSIKYLQVIEVNKHVEEILKKSAGSVEEAYPEIAEYARKNGLMFRLCFFPNEAERVASVWGFDGEDGSEQIAGRSKVTYLQDLDAFGMKRLLAHFNKAFSIKSWATKGTVYGFYNLVAANLNRWVSSEFKRMEDEKAGMPDSSRRPSRFFNNMIKSAVTRYGDTDRYLLVFGEGHDKYTTSGSSHYEVFIGDDKREYDSHEYIGVNEDVEIGSLKFHADTIADHVFYHGKLYGPHSDDGEYSNVTTVNNPQFQFVNKDFEPIDNPYTEK